MYLAFHSLWLTLHFVCAHKIVQVESHMTAVFLVYRLAILAN